MRNPGSERPPCVPAHDMAAVMFMYGYLYEGEEVWNTGNWKGPKERKRGFAWGQGQ